jgi:hypothetical protein
MNTQQSIGGVPYKPFVVFEPYNIIKYLTFFSPLILIIGIVSLSFIFQNFKGILYLLILLAFVVFREQMYNLGYLKTNAPSNKNNVCDSIQYSKNGNSSFSAFVFAFTIMYLCMPMFIYGSVNYWILCGLLSYFLIDIRIKYLYQCFSSGDLLLNIFIGAIISSISVIIIISSDGLKPYLFFNETSSNKEVCSMPKKQTFKCSVYKNGEMISSTIT